MIDFRKKWSNDGYYCYGLSIKGQRSSAERAIKNTTLSRSSDGNNIGSPSL